MYKIIFSDLDGTLLDDNGKISDDNLKYIKKASDKGIRFVICSGRSYVSLEKFINVVGNNKKDDYGICYNGGIIYKTHSNEIITEHRLERDTAVKIAKMCRKYNDDVGVIGYVRDKLIVEKVNQIVDEYCEYAKIDPVVVNDFSDIDEDFSKVVVNGFNTALKKLEKESDSIPNINKFFSSPILYEFGRLGVDKGSALKELCRLLNIDIKEAIAVGDNYNDISMIEQAGLGIAVSNSENEVKEIADYITISSNNDSPFKEIVEKFIL